MRRRLLAAAAAATTTTTTATSPLLASAAPAFVLPQLPSLVRFFHLIIDSFSSNVEEIMKDRTSLQGVAVALGVLAIAAVLLRCNLLTRLIVKQRPESGGSPTVLQTTSAFATTNDRQNSSSTPVRFLAWKTLDFRALSKGLDTYVRERHLALECLSRQLRAALDAEDSNGLPPVLSRHLQAKLERLAVLYERDQRVLAQVLVPFHHALMMPCSPCDRGTRLDPSGPADRSTSRGTFNRTRIVGTALYPVFYVNGVGGVPPGTASGDERNNPQMLASYDTVAQVVAHLVRDWSEDGRSIRRALYDWCADRVRQHVPSGGSVLVPGAGLGRLAWDLAHVPNHPYIVHAVEHSILMAAAAAHVMTTTARIMLHPYASDMFSNELDSGRRYREVSIGRGNDMDETRDYGTQDAVSSSPSRSFVSYTVGDFEMVVSHGVPSSCDAVVTCFFLDTAANVLDYIALIRQVLRRGSGVWINVGPLQWHRHAKLSVTGDELRELLEASGWEILEWTTDRRPVEYRSEEHPHHQHSRSSTHYEAFHPLRFVARHSM